jgi:hypothetical protein
LNPPSETNANWTETILHSFAGPPNDGSYPSGVIAVGNVLYGFTSQGGRNDNGGIVFQLTPPTQSGGTWTETILYSFSQTGVWGPDGLVAGADGVLYGTALDKANSCQCGEVFTLSPPAQTGGTWTERTVYSLASSSLSQPSGLLYHKGELYVESEDGATSGWGTVFELTPLSWNETTLYTFSMNDLVNGVQPIGGLVADGSGNLYGVTRQGGTGTGTSDLGTVFELTP